MKISIVSYFHNAEAYLARYFEQVEELQAELENRGDSLHLVLGTGDNTDETEQEIVAKAAADLDITLVDISHGGKVFGSVVDGQRFKQLAAIATKLWKKIPKDTDMVVVVESDLVWDAASILSLLDGSISLATTLNSPTLLAPMVKGSDGLFYDTWAFRRNGRNFRQQPPYHRDLRQPVEYLEMDSVGSCVVLPMKLASKLHWPEADVFVGFCRLAKERGARIFVDTKTEVRHR